MRRSGSRRFCLRRSWETRCCPASPALRLRRLRLTSAFSGCRRAAEIRHPKKGWDLAKKVQLAQCFRGRVGQDEILSSVGRRRAPNEKPCGVSRPLKFSLRSQFSRIACKRSTIANPRPGLPSSRSPSLWRPASSVLRHEPLKSSL